MKQPSKLAGNASRATKFRVGGVSVAVADTRGEDVPLVSALEPFRDRSDSSDIHIRVQWVRNLPSSSGRRLFDSGTTWRLHECDAGFQFDFSAPAFGDGPYKRLMIDDCFRSATLQMSRERFLGVTQIPEPLDYPLDELLIMHRLTQEKAIELHGTGIVRADGIGNLFVGHSGAGKSTTTRLWTTREEVEVLSDDRIIVRRDDAVVDPVSHHAATDRGRAVGNVRSGKVSEMPLALTQPRKYKLRMYGTPWHGEARYASPNSAPLARIFMLEHGPGNVITPLSSSVAVAELFARSFVPFHRHEYVESALEFLEEVANAVPIYRYAFEPDQRAVDKIIAFHD
jgi:hypothetical protein